MIARMLPMLESANEFQSTLHGVIEMCMNVWNDCLMSIHLSEALFHRSEAVPEEERLLWAVRVLASVQFSPLNSDTKIDDKESDVKESDKDSEYENDDPAMAEALVGEGDICTSENIKSMCDGA
jgi:hypothetical protein